MEGARAVVAFLICVFVYMALDAMKESLSLITSRRHLLEFERACFGDFLLPSQTSMCSFHQYMVLIYAQGEHTLFFKIKFVYIKMHKFRPKQTGTIRKAHRM